MTITSSIVPKSTSGLTAMFLKSDCPGSERVTMPTENLVQLLEELGIDTGVDLYRLVEASHLASRIIGRRLEGHVSLAGPLPYGDHLYPESVPAIETHEQAQHFRLGPDVYAGQPTPWRDRA